ncbi:hypothetical protein FACS189425_01650 [Clostridia bacterium]|nr:hypothetical protein FACS189425_01650 [Clostridia bacterium]
MSWIPSNEKAEFLENIAEHRRLIEPQLTPGLSKRRVIKERRAASKRCKKIMSECDAFIDKYIDSIIDTDIADPTKMSDEQVADLLALAKELYTPAFSQKDVENSKPCLDSYLTVDIYEALMLRARAKKDVDAEIIATYSFANLLYPLGGAIFMPEARDALRTLLDKKIDYFKLGTHEAQKYYAEVPCTHMICVINAEEKTLDQTESRDRANEATMMALDFNDATGWVTDIDKYHEDTIAGMQAAILEIVRENSENQKIITEDFVREKYAFAESLMEPRKEEKDVRAIMNDAIQLINAMDVVNQYYERNKGGQDIDVIMADATELSRRALDWLSKQPVEVVGVFSDCKEKIARMAETSIGRDGSLPAGSETLRGILRAGVPMYNRTERYLERLMKITLNKHMPTCVHSKMVALVMEEIAKYVIKRHPEKLIGICGAITAEEVQVKRKQILKQVYSSGLAHDIGKMFHIQVFSRASRRLRKRERKVLQLHVADGAALFDAQKYGSLHDTALGHQRTANHTGDGEYPKDFDTFASPFKFIIDLCHVADVLDAKTDDLGGRIFQKQEERTKMFGEIVKNELGEFNVDISQMLRESWKLRKALKWILTKGREDVYFEAHQEFSGENIRNDRAIA